MICSYCSAEMPEISSFCPACGRAVDRPGGEDQIFAARVPDLLLGTLAYVTLVPAIVFLVVSSLGSSRFVRFHAWQSILFAVASGMAALATRLLFFVLSVIPFVGFLLAWLSIGLVALAIVVLWGVLVLKAALGEAFELPWLGPLAAHLATKESSI
jgi:uncharacterized membrane protein